MSKPKVHKSPTQQGWIEHGRSRCWMFNVKIHPLWRYVTCLRCLKLKEKK